VDPNAITRPIALRRSTSFSLLDTASPAFAALAYAACLIPRLPSHYLNGEIAAQLAAWLPEVCLAFGWRLLGVQVRPDTCQWVVQLSPTVPPAQMIRAVRQILSQRLFDHFGRLALENPSGDFWAPGYLIISGTQMPSQNMLRMFVVQTRRQQGLQMD
jgi:REP element-mobilizing transposase RayT